MHEAVNVREDGPKRTGSRRAGSALGLAVHAVLQRAELDNLGDLESVAEAAAREHGVEPTRVVEYARRAAFSEPVREAVRSGRLWREVPVGAQVGQTLIEGTIDLLYAHSDGTLGVVDYKTDRASKSSVVTHAARYELQGGAYALAVQHAVQRKVSTVEFVFAALAEDGVIRYGAEEVVALAGRAERSAREGELSEVLLADPDDSSVAPSS
jgi:ATP-dependent exoDNAse (exonuclease V) beta subunit